MVPQHLTNGLEGEHNWCAVGAIACRGLSPEADTVCLSLTALDTGDGVCMYSSTKLWDAHCIIIYQVEDLHTNDWTNKGLWVTPHQVGVGEPGEDHTQGWGAWRCKGWQRMGWRELREQYRVVRCLQVQ